MNTQTLFHTCLALHLIGFTALAGGIVANLSIHRKLSKYFQTNPPLAITSLENASGLFRMISLGGALLILSGVGMMALTNGTFGEMLWFRIKMGLVVLIVLNVFVTARPAFAKLQALLKTNNDA